MIQAAVIGAGSRGMFALAAYALTNPHELQIVAVAEPNEERRLKFAKMYGVPPEQQFATWEELLNQPQLCDAVIITTMDRDHYEPTMKALEVGYHILVEKPLSPNPAETIRMAQEAESRGRILSVCHGMRYSPYFSSVKRLLDRQVVGRLMSIQWTENVGYWHQAHSFVRGNWRNSKESSTMLLQKCCHDMDFLQWIIDAECERVSSFGNLSYFREENAPQGSTNRCIDGCKVEHECPFSAVKLYLNDKDEWPARAVSLDPSLAARTKALKEGPYGRCVYRCDNDVVDHQVVNLHFANEVTVAFTMAAFSRHISRTFKIMGTTGEMIGDSHFNEIEIRHFSGETEVIRPSEIEGGHGGADTIIVQNFVRQVESGEWRNGLTSGMESARSHMIVYAAEESRRTGETVHLPTYVRKITDTV